MATDNRARELTGRGRLAPLLVGSPGIPLITQSVGGDTEVVLTINADTESDTVFIRYRPLGGDAWSAESGALSRVGDGDVTVTGLTNLTRYQFAAYAKEVIGMDNLFSDWDFSEATPTEGTVTPTALDTKMRAKALALITEKGKLLKYYVPGTTTYDPTTGIGEQAGVTEYVLRSSPPRGAKEKYVAGELVKEGDHITLLPAKDLAFDPAGATRVEVDAEEWRIISVEPIRSGQQVAVWKLLLRR